MRSRLVTTTLHTCGGLAVGGEADAADRPVLRDQLGQPTLTGTGLGGALRAAARLRYGEEVTTAHFGHVDGDDAETSPIVVHTPEWIAPPPAADGQPVAVVPDRRDHVAIDRERLTARPGSLFDEETWPTGLAFTLRFECDKASLPMLRGALEELSGPLGGLGAGACPVTVDLTSAQVAHTDWSPRRSLQAALNRKVDGEHDRWPTTEPFDLPRAARSEAPQQPRGPVAATFDLTVACTDPLLCSVPLDPSAEGGDNWPFSVTRLQNGHRERAAAIPAESLRGVLRQRVERAWHHAGRPGGDPWSAHPDPTHPVLRLFGRAPTGRDDAGHAGVLRVSDFVAAWHPHCDPDELPETTVYPRVGHDRLTFATLGSAKWEDTAVRRGTTLSGRLTLAPLDGRWDDTDLAGLVRGVTDLHHGLTGVGSDTQSGYGTLRVADATLRLWHRSVDGLKPHQSVDLREWGHWPDHLRERMADAWQHASTAQP